MERTAGRAAGRGGLRLVGDDPGLKGPAWGTVILGRAKEPIVEPTDPRWVLAVRTAEQLEGSVLRPEKRQRLVRVGQMMGLTTFDCHLIIAMVQDRARRGRAAELCPAAVADQLALVPKPEGRGRDRRGDLWRVAAMAVLLVAMQMLALMWVLG